MGLFDRFKRKTADNENVDKRADAWMEAYQAKPQAYRDPEGGSVIVFTLTEDTDTVLPEDPASVYLIAGAPASQYRLGFYSLKEDKVIADLPYYTCMAELKDFVTEKRGDQLLIRRLAIDEIHEVIQCAESTALKQHRLSEAFVRNFEFLRDTEMSVEIVDRLFSDNVYKTFRFEDVSFGGGRLVVADPLAYLANEETIEFLQEEIVEGHYSEQIAILDSEDIGLRIGGLRLLVNENTAVRFTCAKSVEGKEAGFPVDAGLATICDSLVAREYAEFTDNWYAENEGKNIYDDYFADLFQKSYETYPDLQREGGDFIRFRIPSTNHEIIMAATGFGDGYYNIFAGYDEKDTLCQVVTVFIDPRLFNAEGLSQ